MTFTRTAAPEWLLALWKEIDDKTSGTGFDCFADDAVYTLSLPTAAAKRTAITRAPSPAATT